MAPGKKGALYGLLFLLLAGGALFLLLRGQDPHQLARALGQASPPWLLAGVGCMGVYFVCEAKNIQQAFAIFGAPAPLGACLRYAMAGFFFSSVTPSASGGQPAQLYLMCRDGQGAASGALALLTCFFSFQVGSVVLAGLGIALHGKTLLSLHRGLLVCFLAGVLLNLFVVFLLCAAVFSRRLLPALGRRLRVPAARLFPGRLPGWEAWAAKQWADLRQCTACFRQHKGTLAAMLARSLLQLAAYHSVPFWVYRSFGLAGEGLLTMILLQALLFFSVSSLPLPGAVGLTEGGFLLLYRALFPAALLPSAMVLSRGVSFYLVLLVSGLFLSVTWVRPHPLPSNSG